MAQPHDDPAAHDPAEAIIFSARLTPHRSLNRTQFHVLLCAVGLGGIVTSLPFVFMGAWPVAGFMGLDVLAVYVAFRASFRSARAYEDVNLTMLELMVAKVSPRGRRAEWRFNPSWVRLSSSASVKPRLGMKGNGWAGWIASGVRIGKMWCRK